MRINLHITDGPSATRTMFLRPPVVIQIGRTEASDLSVPEDPMMSSVHFRLECETSGVRIRDLGSTNGTFVNGERVEESSLSDGDQIVAGQTTFCLKLEGAIKPAAPIVDQATTREPVSRTAELKPSNIGIDAEAASVQPQETPVEPVPDAIAGIEPGARSEDAFAITTPDIESVVATVADSAQYDVLGAVLEVAEGPTAVKKIWVRPNQSITVGRTERADVNLAEDDLLSSLHFAVAASGQGWLIRDLDSRNWTTVNGRRVSQKTLADGDKIVAGRTTFVVRIGRGAGSGAVTAPAELPFQDALQDEDELVRREALYAAVWTRQPWLLDHCRQAAANPEPENIAAVYLLAVLGDPTELTALLEAGKDNSLGAKWYDVLGAYGHPDVMKDILAGIKSEDPRVAVSAGAAFSRITGCDIESDESVELPPRRRQRDGRV